MKIEVEINVSSGGQARRFARIFRYMNLEFCRNHAANDEEAIFFLESIDKILSEVRKNVHCEAQVFEVKSTQQHHAYLEEVKGLMMKKPQLGTSDSDRLELLAGLIEDYETKHYPLPIVSQFGSKSCIKT